MGDPFRIRQILTNLIGNAFKFTEEGYIEISAKTKSKRGKSVVLQIDVTDTGIGIAKENNNLYSRNFRRPKRIPIKNMAAMALD